MDEQKKPSGGVSIGSVGGDISGSMIAGGDISNATVSFAGKTMSVDDDPAPEDVAGLLKELQKALAELSDAPDALSEVSAAAPYTVAGVREVVDAAASRLEGEVTPETAQSARDELKEAATLASVILGQANTLVEGTTGIGRAVEGVVEKLEPVVRMLGVAGMWVGRLWLGV